jgi:hypothetical protein
MRQDDRLPLTAEDFEGKLDATGELAVEAVSHR